MLSSPRSTPQRFSGIFAQCVGKLRLVFHSAHEGRKLRMMEENPHVCFEMEPHVEMTGGGQRVRNYTTYFDCIMGEGTLRRVNESPEKERLLRILVEHHGLTGEWEVAQSHLDRCTALLLEADWVSMKRKVPAPGLPVK